MNQHREKPAGRTPLYIVFPGWF